MIRFGWIFALLVGCGVGPELTPFRGPKPNTILVVPSDRPANVDDTAAFDLAVGEALESRGYATLTGMAAVSKLVAIGWNAQNRRLDGLPLGQLAERFGVDAIWTSSITDWRFESRPGLPFVFALDCSIYATRNQRLLWSQSLDGEQRSAIRRAGVDPFADREPFEASDPVPWRVETEVLDAREMARLVAQNVSARLPAN